MRREFSKRVKLAIVQRAMNARGQVVCEGCNLILAGKRFEIDHILAEALVIDKTKSLTAADGQLLGVECCHRGGRNKTADDVRQIRKSDRQRYGHLGIKRPTTFRKPPPGYGYSWKLKRYVKMEGTAR